MAACRNLAPSEAGEGTPAAPSRWAQVGKLAFFRISDNLGPKAHLARSDNYANKPRRKRENFGASTCYLGLSEVFLPGG